MKNNKGFGKFEVLTMIVLLMGIFAFLAYRFLGGADVKKLDTLKSSATNMVKTVVVNKESFYNPRQVYLGEIIDEQLLKDIKNPIGGGNCSRSASYVQLDDHNNYVTLQCGEYLLDHVEVNSVNDAKFYHVGEWTKKKTNDNDEEKVFYNCEENGKKVFDENYEESYFVYQINRLYSLKYYSVSDVEKLCKVEKITMYRTKEEVEK